MYKQDSYRETKIKTAGQSQLIVMLYDKAIFHLDNALSYGEATSLAYDKFNGSIGKTQEIITELMASLDFEQGGEFASRLFNLYMFFNQTLVQANLNKEKNGILIIRDFLIDLRAAWAAIESRASQMNHPMAGGIQIDR